MNLTLSIAQVTTNRHEGKVDDEDEVPKVQIQPTEVIKVNNVVHFNPSTLVDPATLKSSEISKASADPLPEVTKLHLLEKNTDIPNQQLLVS